MTCRVNQGKRFDVAPGLLWKAPQFPGISSLGVLQCETCLERDLNGLFNVGHLELGYGDLAHVAGRKNDIDFSAGDDGIGRDLPGEAAPTVAG